MNKLLKKWKDILGLNDWVIGLELDCNPSEMNLQQVAGEVEADELHKCAIIRLLDEKYYGQRILPYNKEKTLVHELLHIKLWFIDRSESDLQNRLVHQFIEELANTLVDLETGVNNEKI